MPGTTPVPGPAPASGTEPALVGAVALAASEEWRLTTLAGDYRIFLALPEGAAPPEGFPVLTVLDANACFATVAEAMRRATHRPGATGVRPAAVVGIGYPTEGSYSQERRRLDYTPGPSSEGGDGPCGGRDRFLDTILHRVRPLVRARFPVDEARQSLLGHSLGGFFALDVLLHDTGCFRDYVAISPSVWWDRSRLERGIAALARRAGEAPAPRAALSVGAWEQSLAPWQRNRPDSEVAALRRGRRAMVDNAREVAALLGEALPPDAVRFDLFPDEDHASVFPVALGRALRFLAG
ncbi:alpha/beta hydrolase [Roseomonas elaeocarpi]|uniref:Alpha/beta hydrolase n=1 Tax=Roseomonas elaeocarpi TaxID=907779 RepID=A0ABV6JVY4_9PROT